MSKVNLSKARKSIKRVMERLVVVFNAVYAIERKVVQFIMPVGGCTLGLKGKQKYRVGCWLTYD